MGLVDARFTLQTPWLNGFCVLMDFGEAPLHMRWAAAVKFSTALCTVTLVCWVMVHYMAKSMWTLEHCIRMWQLNVSLRKCGHYLLLLQPPLFWFQAFHQISKPGCREFLPKYHILYIVMYFLVLIVTIWQPPIQKVNSAFYFMAKRSLIE